MNWKHGPRGYHHGNLREALIDAALALIAEKGVGGLALAEAAREVGVSPAAPYRHFRDRDELLAGVALRGFERFEAALTVAWNQGLPDPVRAFERLGRAYLAFARTEPGFYAAMFEAGGPRSRDPALLLAGEKAFGVLRGAADTMVGSLPQPGRPPSLMVALHLWSMAHGIAALFGRGTAAGQPLPMAPEELLEAGLLVYLQGLGLTL